MSEKFTIIDNNILDNENLSIQEQSLLIALKSYVNKEKGYAYPSYSQLKRRSKISDNRTLLKNIDSIIKKGYITKKTFKGIGCRYYFSEDSGELHQVENYTTCKITSPPSGELHHDQVENYTTTNTNTNTNTNKKEKCTSLDKIINSYSQNEDLRTTLKDFLKMRKSIKKPMTDRALNIMLKKLSQYANTPEKQISILEVSIENCWQGIFPLKDTDKTNLNNSNKPFEFD